MWVVKHIDEAILVTLLKNTQLKHGERKLYILGYFSHSGANVPGSESSRERKLQGAKVPGSESFAYGKSESRF